MKRARIRFLPGFVLVVTGVGDGRTSGDFAPRAGSRAGTSSDVRGRVGQREHVRRQPRRAQTLPGGRYVATNVLLKGEIAVAFLGAQPLAALPRARWAGVDRFHTLRNHREGEHGVSIVPRRSAQGFAPDDAFAPPGAIQAEGASRDTRAADLRAGGRTSGRHARTANSASRPSIATRSLPRFEAALRCRRGSPTSRRHVARCAAPPASSPAGFRCRSLRRC